ncbi:MAG: amino acid ABC transporter permease, partial [Acidisphaera sp.]|nr:amino acid ABC transporter permease [Acidisphaera sp.]
MLPEADAVPTTQPHPIVRLRYVERWVLAAVILTLAAAVLYVLSRADIAYRDVPGFFVYPIMLQGLWHTIVLAIAAQSAAVVVGVVIAIMRVSRNPVASWTAWAYIWVFRGLPVLLQILIWYNLALAFQHITVPGVFSVATNTVISPFVAALLGLGMNESAYMAEIVRAGFNSIDKGQIEAAHSIGMTPGKTLRRVILPQAMRVIIPP